jgi:hypothetical protein
MKGQKHCSNTLNSTSKTRDMQMEFDPIGIRCDFDEYENLKEIKENYQDIETLEDLRDRTIVIEIPNSDRLIIQAF